MRLTQTELAEISAALAPHVHRTPLVRSTALSDLTGLDVRLKAELFQKTGSFKVRGMLWRLMTMSEEQRRRGLVTFSAGNAAQGLAYAGRLLGAPVTVCMPAAASPAKAEATRGYGAEVILTGTPKECWAFATDLAEASGATFVSSYDDIDLMRGHATLGAEIVEDLAGAPLEAVFAGVGGGGLLGGLVMAMEALEQEAQLFGVEPRGAAAMSESLLAGTATTLPSVSTIADGLAAPSAGTVCYEVIRRRVEDVVVLDDTALVEAMLLLMTRAKLFAEPAGAAGVAGLLSVSGTLRPGATVVCVVSGGNLDPERLKALL